MRKIILCISIILFSILGYAQNKTSNIRKGETFRDITFTAADTVNESETYYIEVTNKQSFPQMQDVLIDIDSVSGGPGVTITLYGKKFSGDTYASIGTSVVWGGTTSDTTIIYTNATANRYRFLKLEFVADATDQQSLITDVKFKTWMTGGDLSTSGLTLSGALTAASVVSPLYDVSGAAGITFGSADATKFTFSGISEDLVWTPSANTWTLSTSTGVTAIAVGALNLTGVGTIGSGKVSSTAGVDLGTSQALTGTTALTIGAGTETVAINSSDWDIDATGVITGIGNITSDGLVSTATLNTTGLAQISTINFADATAVAGTGDVITIDFTTDLTISVGTIIYFIAEAANTTNVTINVDAAGAVALEEYNGAQSALDANDIRDAQCVQIMWNGTAYVMLSSSGN